MFTQFFGNFLLNEQYVTAEQLLEAIHAKNKTRLKLGVLAIDAGYMTAEQVEEVHERQMFEDKRIGDIAVELGYMTREQVEELLGNQRTGYLLLGQALVDQGIMTNAQFENAITKYKNKFRITEDKEAISDEKAAQMVEELCDFSYEESKLYTNYIVLLLKNLVRFIGDDFTPLNPVSVFDKENYKSILQSIKGQFATDVAVVFSDEESMLEFGNRYSNEEFDLSEMEYIEAAACDFININNGLFTVNVSNELNMELSLTPPEIKENELGISGDIMVFPVQFTFGTVDFVISK